MQLSLEQDGGLPRVALVKSGTFDKAIDLQVYRARHNILGGQVRRDLHQRVWMCTLMNRQIATVTEHYSIAVLHLCIITYSTRRVFRWTWSVRLWHPLGLCFILSKRRAMGLRLTTYQLEPLLLNPIDDDLERLV